MARKKLKAHPLPEWFNLKHYDAFLSVSNDVLVSHVNDRLLIWGSGMTTGIEAFVEQLKSGDLMLQDLNESMEKITAHLTIDDSLMPGLCTHLAQDYAVKPVSFRQLGSDYERAIRDGFEVSGLGIRRADQPESTKNTKFRNANISACLPDNDVRISLAVDNFTDAEILESIAKLLPIWRKQLNQPEKDKQGSRAMGTNLIKRIIEYRVIPMIDLMMWGELNGFKYSAEQLSNALYPDEIVTAKHTLETRIPFAMNFMNQDYVDSVNLWLRQPNRDAGKPNGAILVKDTINYL